MEFNKTIAKTMFFALGLGAFSLLGAYEAKAAQAAKPQDSEVTLEVATESIKITGANGKFWGVAKVEKNEKIANIKGGTENYKVTDVNPVVENYIDLSSLSKGKDLYIAVGSTDTPNETTWYVKKILAASKTFAFEYVTSLEAGKKVKGADDAKALGHAEVGYFIAASDKDTVLDLSNTTDNAKIEVQEGDGAWATLATFLGTVDDAKTKEKLENYVQTGKTLKFRMKQDKAWNSNEVTVKIPSLPKAPKIKFDVTKGTVSLKDGMQYKRTVASGTTDANYVDVTKKMTLTDLQAYEDTGIGVKGGTITVRTKAKGKTLPSKEAVYTINKQDAPTVAAIPNSKQEADLITDNVSTALKVKYDLKKGATLTNTGTNAYEYFLSYTGEAPTADAKWKKLPPAKTKGTKKTPTKVNLKYSATEKADTFGGDSTKIFIRLAGIKQEGNTVTLASKAAGAKFVFAPISQAFTKEGGSANSSTHAAKVGKETTEKITLKISNVQDAKKSVKVKVTSKVNGVTVKASKLKVATDHHTVDITIKVSKSAFKDASPNNQLIFDLSIESAKLTHTCTINATKD